MLSQLTTLQLHVRQLNKQLASWQIASVDQAEKQPTSRSTERLGYLQESLGVILGLADEILEKCSAKEGQAPRQPVARCCQIKANILPLFKQDPQLDGMTILIRKADAAAKNYGHAEYEITLEK